MFRSKSRSEAVENGKNHHHHSSLFSRSFSSSKFCSCRGDSIAAQIDRTALIKSSEKKPFKHSILHSDSSEDRIDTVAAMQHQMTEMEEKLSESELEKQRLVKELREARALAEAAPPSGKVEDLTNEIESLKKMLSDRGKRARELEAILAEKDEFIDRLNKELNELRDREKGSMALVSENRRRIEELEGVVERRKESESRTVNSLAVKTRELDNLEFELQETKIELATLYEKLESLESLYKHGSGNLSDQEAGILKAELKLAREREKKALSKVEAMQDEMDVLKQEWRRALDAEQQNAKAMDDLAMALAEVAAEAKQVKEKSGDAGFELKQAQEEIELLKLLLNSARHEAEVQKNTADELRLEMEESMLAWHGKEMGFVSCIKRAEEEKAAALLENTRLAESLKAAENMTRAAREETYKSRDLLKQALNEANAAKAAAGLARDENSQLKDSLVEKEETLHFLTRENESLRISEAAAQETIKQLKRMLSSSSSTEIKIDDLDHHDAPEPDSSDSSDDSPNEKHVTKVKDKNKDEDEDDDEEKISTEGFAFNLAELKQLTEPEDFNLKIVAEDPQKAEALKGSIFDDNASTPKSEPHTPKRSLSNRKQRRYSFSYAELNQSSTNPEASEASEASEAFDTSEYDYSATFKQYSHRRVKTMFRRVGGLLTIKRGSSSRKDQSLPSPPASQSSVE